MEKRGSRLAIAMAILLGGLAGCSDCDDKPGPAPQTLRGTVQSGAGDSARGIAGASVGLLAAGSDADELLAEATTDADGQFTMTVPATDDDRVYFVRASAGTGIVLAAVLGETVPDAVVVNELTTVATAFAFAQFIDVNDLHGDPLALSIAAAMSTNLADIATGEPSPVLLASPNADQTVALRSVRTLANLIAGCVQGPVGNCDAVFDLTTPPPPAERTRTTLEALVRIARNPAQNVAALFAQAQAVTPYEPPLTAMPDAWTLAVKVNQTGSAMYPWGGSANTVFDDRGYAWINNNTVQGESISTMSLIVLQPDGRPADGTDGTPQSPITGGGLLGAGFGVARSPVDGTIWVGNFGWGGLNPGPEGTGTGSVSHFAADGTPLSPDDGYDGGTDRVQGLIVDHDGNVWTANYGNDKLVVFLGGDPDDAIAADVPCHPFGLARAADGTVWLATIGAGLPNQSDDCDTRATVTHWRLDGRELVQLSLTEVGAELKGLDIDFEDHVWVASGGDDTVYRLAPDGTVVGAFNGGGINAPWSVRIDDAGNVWVANFGVMDIVPPHNIYDPAALSVLAGPNSPSGLPVGAPISPETGYTLPSAGEPVLLSDGTPLNETGNGQQPAFTALMRAVSAVPDRAGNVWVTNNWKPNFTADLIGDPGGDGVVIFVGIAAPTEPGRTQ